MNSTQQRRRAAVLHGSGCCLPVNGPQVAGGTSLSDIEIAEIPYNGPRTLAGFGPEVFPGEAFYTTMQVTSTHPRDVRAVSVTVQNRDGLRKPLAAFAPEICCAKKSHPRACGATAGRDDVVTTHWLSVATTGLV